MLLSKNPYTFFNEYIIRVPILPLGIYLTLGEKKEITKNDLLHIWSFAEFREGLFLASPDFFQICIDYFKNNSDTKKIKDTLLKYIIRSCTRSTPFGLFAGLTTGGFGKDTSVVLDKTNTYTRISRLDMSFIFALSQWLSKEKNIQLQLRFFPNSSLYTIENQYRYIEYALQKTERKYSIEGIEKTPHLEKIILFASKGKTINELAEILVDKVITYEEAKYFIQTLVKHQLLVSELELTVTGEDNLSQLIQVLSQLDNALDYLNQLKVIQGLLIELDKKIGNENDQYQKLYQQLDATELGYTKQHAIQTDLFVNCYSSYLSKKYAYTVQKALPVLNKLTLSQESKNLEAFKKVFLERYETCEVPLTKALDIESGIGYLQNQSQTGTTPFLDDIELPKSQQSQKEEISLHPINIFLHEKLLETIYSKDYVMELKDVELNELGCDWDDLPDTFSAMIEIIGEKDKEQVVLKSIGGTSAANLNARFCHGSNELKKHVQQIIDWEEHVHPDKIMSEIVHLPEARTGNILKRSSLRAYEIPYLAKANASLKHQISVNDLYVSIRNNKIVLRSKYLQKEVLPRLTNAHNYATKALPIYHFLCDLQRQDLRTRLGFTWPKETEKYYFLPRVIYKNCILSKAQWRLKKEDIHFFLALKEDENKLLKQINQWREKYSVPLWVQLVEYDNILPIHLGNITLIRLWLTTVKNKEECRLEEFLFTKTDLVKRDQHSFGHEIVLSFYKKKQNLNSA